MAQPACAETHTVLRVSYSINTVSICARSGNVKRILRVQPSEESRSILGVNRPADKQPPQSIAQRFGKTRHRVVGIGHLHVQPFPDLLRAKAGSPHSFSSA